MNTYGYVGGNPLYWTDPYGLVQWTDLGFGLIDFSLSTTEAIFGAGIMASSPATGPASPAAFTGGFLIASHGIVGMLNSGLAIKNALFDTNDPGLVEGTCGALFGEDAAKVGKAVDMFGGLRPAAIASGSIDNFKDVYDLLNGGNNLANTFGKKDEQ